MITKLLTDHKDPRSKMKEAQLTSCQEDWVSNFKPDPQKILKTCGQRFEPQR
ncbi:uncharacterized protein G2W53_008772 [Senna tora]|uniref:Uncharacterized protein n=1 Tax=Senna tora TaxID=362788 RepID=A0A834WX43_9FABA|nr:uncharacterized protein G2W53_008772 [Senna tora]